MTTILIDIDNVVVRFTDLFLAIHNRLHGRNYSPKNVTDWNFRSVATEQEYKAIFSWIDESPGLVYGIREYAGAYEAINYLRAHGHTVVAVTAPHWGETWMFERAKKLHEMWFKDSEIVFCHDKSLVRGDILIDDAPHNVSAFPGRGVLLRRPWNQDFEWADCVSGLTIDELSYKVGV